MTLIEYFICFGLFILFQSLMINGIYECFAGNCTNDVKIGRVCKGNIFFKLNPEWFVKNKEKNWALPIFGCVKCMSSFWGTISYWTFVLLFLGFDFREIPVWMGDLF